MHNTTISLSSKEESSSTDSVESELNAARSFVPSIGFIRMQCTHWLVLQPDADG